MEEIIEENATLEFERANMSEGYRGGLKRILSTSSDLFSGSQLQIAGIYPRLYSLAISLFHVENNLLRIM